jgi:hypothetical protein
MRVKGFYCDEGERMQNLVKLKKRERNEGTITRSLWTDCERVVAKGKPETRRITLIMLTAKKKILVMTRIMKLLPNPVNLRTMSLPVPAVALSSLTVVPKTIAIPKKNKVKSRTILHCRYEKWHPLHCLRITDRYDTPCLNRDSLAFTMTTVMMKMVV